MAHMPLDRRCTMNGHKWTHRPWRMRCRQFQRHRVWHGDADRSGGNPFQALAGAHSRDPFANAPCEIDIEGSSLRLAATNLKSQRGPNEFRALQLRTLEAHYYSSRIRYRDHQTVAWSDPLFFP